MDNNKEASTLKNIITGILISNPKISTIRDLCRDFLDLEGCTIPFNKFGFNNVEEYLRSIPDVVQVNGTGPHAIISVFVSSKTQHINEMVLRQRKSKPSGFKNPRKHSKPSISQRYNSTRKQQKPSVPHFIPSLLSLTVPKPLILPSSCVVNKVELPVVELKELSPILSDTETSLLNISGSTYLTEDIINVSSGCVENVNGACSLELSQFSDDTFLEEARKSKVPIKVQKNVRQLIGLHPNGLECTEVQTEYKRLFKKKIHHEDYGFGTLIDLLFDLSHIVSVVQTRLDCYVVYDQSKPIPVLNEEATVDNEVVEIVVEKHILQELANPDKNLLIPSDVLNISDSIPRFFPEDIDVGDLLDVTVGEIYDLSKFWVYLTLGNLDLLMKNLQSFFISNHSRYLIPSVLLEEGLYCVALYVNQYHRCVVVHMLPSQVDFIRVLFIDFGTVENVRSDSIWFLPKEFAEVPCQAIRVRLANIYPTYENRPWSLQSIVRFEQLTQSNALVAEITKIDETDHILEIYLADITNKNKIFFLNDLLVKEKLACYVGKERKPTPIDPDCKPNVKYIHLYPQFYEIEAGFAPTPEERRYLTESKLPMHHYMSQYFDIRYEEDLDCVILQHERMIPEREQISNRTLTIPNVEEEEFDYSLFPDFVKEMRDLVEKTNNNKSKPVKQACNGVASMREYSCNRKRVKELLSSLPNDENIQDSISDLNITSDSEITTHLENLSLSETESSLTNISAEPLRNTNPFLDDSFKETNPFRSTNPFRDSDLFSKSSNESLSQAIVNNLKDNHCKLIKDTNLKNSIGNKSLESKEVKVSPPRVRTPPGFTSAHRQIRAPVVPNFPQIQGPPQTYYPFIQNNNILMQNQLFMALNPPPVFNYGNYFPPFFPNQFNGPRIFPNNFPRRL